MRQQPQLQTQSSQSWAGQRDYLKIRTNKAEELKNKLKGNDIPEEDWIYYLTHPQTWDYNNMSASGLCKGVEVILLTPTQCIPIWIDEKQTEIYNECERRNKKI